MITKVSFCILGESQSDVVFNRCVASIRRQGVPRSEILACCPGRQHDAVQMLRSDGWAESGEFNRMRNLLCAQAAEEFIVILSEDVELSDGWYAALKNVDCFDVIGSRLVTESGIRAIDWAYAVKLGSKTHHFPLSYDEWTTKAYLGDRIMLLRKQVWERVKFDAALKRDEGDVSDFCLRATQQGFRLGIFPQAEARYIPAGSVSANDNTFESSKALVAAFREAFAEGKEAFRLANYGKALTHLSQARELAPDDANVLSYAGWAHYSTGQYSQALELLGHAVRLDPDNHFAWRGRGWTFLQRGEHHNAVESFGRALTLVNLSHRNDWLETQRGLSWANYHVGNFDEAIKQFAAILERGERQDAGLLQDVYRGLGWSCFRKEMYHEASCHFEQAISFIANETPELLQEARRGLKLAKEGAVSSDAPKLQQNFSKLSRPPIFNTTPSKSDQKSLWRRRLGVVKRSLRKFLWA